MLIAHKNARKPGPIARRFYIFRDFDDPCRVLTDDLLKIIEGKQPLRPHANGRERHFRPCVVWPHKPPFLAHDWGIENGHDLWRVVDVPRYTRDGQTSGFYADDLESLLKEHGFKPWQGDEEPYARWVGSVPPKTWSKS